MNGKLLPALGAGFWILGLTLSILGLNISAPTGSWLSVIGNILFLAGLCLEGIWWFRRRREKKTASDSEQ